MNDDKFREVQIKLKDYAAKGKADNKSIYDHNIDLDKIRKDIKDVFEISKELDDKLYMACMLHDLGKATDFFQENLESRNRTIRHEILSASIEGLDDDVRLAILTHHKDFNKLKGNIVRREYPEELQELAEKFELDFEDIEGFLDDCNSRKREDLTKKLDNIILKGMLNYCDHLASAGIRSVDKGFNALTEFKIPKEYNSIQRKILSLEKQEDILIIAMTGLGKTAASMYWSNLVQNETKSKRVYYILPYTASINSLFKDIDNRGISVAMLHSKAEYFLSKYKSYFSKEDYSYFKKSVKQINICTIFQLIKAMFSCKRFEMLISQMKNSIFIVDEIHCFNVRELSYILEMLKWLKENLGAKVCIMSASIPTCLQSIIKDRLGIETVIKPDKKDLKIRHKLIRKNKMILEELDKIEKHLKAGEKVIICVNSVETAQELYEKFANDYNSKLVHGRFNTRDREKAEQGLRDSQLLIGTQAIEVSLDIDYDTMFTELAPLDALLQRFGRVNRFGLKGIANIYIYDYVGKIYNRDLLKNTDKVICEIIESGAIVLEEKVNHYLDKVYKKFELDEYENYIEKFGSLIDGFKIGKYLNRDFEETMGNDTIMVLPNCLFNEYTELIDQRKYLEAESLKVNIKKYKLKDKDLFERNSDYRITVVNYKYNPKTGLKFEADF